MCSPGRQPAPGQVPQINTAVAPQRLVIGPQVDPNRATGRQQLVTGYNAPNTALQIGGSSSSAPGLRI